MADAMVISLHPWAEGDLHLLERANTPAMTTHLGGPEPAEEIPRRHARYLARDGAGEICMRRIEVDGVPAGSIGFWPADEEGHPVWETGWSVLPEFQGRGVARTALRLLLPLAAARTERRTLVAYPSVDNAASNAVCRGAGFTLVGRQTEQWRGSTLTFHIWSLALTERSPHTR